ncbi:MAG: hypothetical protein JST44_24945 [Cyanobacteria bacterium SZAS LIN-5]|nr:hypothetical protein [Cyanobacteria bacterium SZAS LIN-5]
MSYHIKFLGANPSSSILARALGELAMLNPPLDSASTAEAFVALSSAHDLLIRLSVAMPSENLDSAIFHFQGCRASFDSGNFAIAQSKYGDVLAALCTGGMKRVSCVIRAIHGNSYFCWDFPTPGENYYTFTGVPHVVQIEEEFYLIWLLAMPNKIKVKQSSK